MTPAEKAAMRATIFGAPAPVAVSTASPYFFFDVQFMSRAVAGVLVFVLVGGSGVAYAAESSLPGDTLYAVKIHVNERVEIALASTPEQKLAVETTIAERRVAEAQTLAAAGRLDAAISAEIEKNFDEHASRALALSGEDALAVSASIAPEVSTVAPVAARMAAGTEVQTSDQESKQGHGQEQEDSALLTTTMMLKTATVLSEASSSSATEVQVAEDTNVTQEKEVAPKKKKEVRKVREALELQKNILRELKERAEKDEDSRSQDGNGDSGDR